LPGFVGTNVGNNSKTGSEKKKFLKNAKKY
jgi:hypothetical protein